MTAVTLAVAIGALVGVFVLLVVRRPPQPKPHGVPHINFSGDIVDRRRVLLGRDIVAARVKVRTDRRATLKLICEDNSFLEVRLEAE